MKTFSVILIAPNGKELLFTSFSLERAKKVFDEYASKGIGKDNSLHLVSLNKIRSLYVFE